MVALPRHRQSCTSLYYIPHVIHVCTYRAGPAGTRVQTSAMNSSLSSQTEGRWYWWWWLVGTVRFQLSWLDSPRHSTCLLMSPSIQSRVTGSTWKTHTNKPTLHSIPGVGNCVDVEGHSISTFTPDGPHCILLCLAKIADLQVQNASQTYIVY